MFRRGGILPPVSSTVGGRMPPLRINMILLCSHPLPLKHQPHSPTHSNNQHNRPGDKHVPAKAAGQGQLDIGQIAHIERTAKECIVCGVEGAANVYKRGCFAHYFNADAIFCVCGVGHNLQTPLAKRGPVSRWGQNLHQMINIPRG